MLWEALAGRHPFWRSSLLETAARDRGGRAAARDACGPTCRSRSSPLVDRALVLDPARRPPAQRRLPARSAARRRKRRGRRAGVDACAVPAAVRSAARRRPRRPRRGLDGWALPFFPAGWPLGPRRGSPRLPRSSTRGSGSPSRSPCPCCRSGTSRSASPSSTGASPQALLVADVARARARAALRTRPAAGAVRRTRPLPAGGSSRPRRAAARPGGGSPSSWPGSLPGSAAFRSRSTAPLRRISGSPRAATRSAVVSALAAPSSPSRRLAVETLVLARCRCSCSRSPAPAGSGGRRSRRRIRCVGGRAPRPRPWPSRRLAWPLGDLSGGSGALASAGAG